MLYFDYEDAAQKAGVSTDLLRAWQDGFAREYTGDEMMIELRLLRACNAAAIGPEQLASVARALEEEFDDNGTLLRQK